MKPVHYPVLHREVLEYLEPKSPEDILVDGTLGEGGHTELFLSRFPRLKVIGVETDPVMLERAKERLRSYHERVTFWNGWFDEFFLHYRQETGLDRQPGMILLDLGISTFHLKQSGRGFSFQGDEPLDMRLGKNSGLTASEVLNRYPLEDLVSVFSCYGEERYSKRIARAVVKKRDLEPFTTTAQFRDTVESAVPPQYRRGPIHPATKCFQALRIEVNRELDRLEAALAAAFNTLSPGGRFGVISFHSLEDRKVKHFFREMARKCTCPPEEPKCVCGGIPRASLITRKPVRPGETEIRENPASRSAKLRVLEKEEQ
ncbi:MAG: 16S rRNA (cytosine(1402)-N(4))-methyltransferase RsmH [Spirochaetia bacterium]